MKTSHLLALSIFFPLLALAAPETIPDVNVSVDKPTTIKKSDAYVQTTRYSEEELANSPQDSPIAFLRQNQSIVRFVAAGGDATQAGVSIRGFGDNAVANSLILVDGFPLTNPSLLAPNLNSIALADIERIDIYQGSEGTLWGDQAVGGVINILTRHPKNWVFNTTLTAGSYRKQFGSIFIGDKFSNGIYTKAFALGNKTRNYREYNQQTDWNVAGTGGYDYNSGSISFNVQAFEDTIHLPGALTQEQFETNPRQANSTTTFTHLKTNVYQILSRQALNETWLLETRLSQQTTRGDGFFMSTFDRLDTTNRFSPRLYGLIYKTKVTTGIDLQRSQFTFESARADSHVKTTQEHLYAQTITPLTNTLDFTLGARAAQQLNWVDSVTSRNPIFVTEAGLSFRPADNLIFFLRRDGNFRFPKSNEQTFIPTGQTALKKQTGVSYEAGTEWLYKNSKTQINLYHLALDNEIAFDPTPTEMDPFGSFSNFDKTVRNGITITEVYEINKKVRLNGQLNWVDPRFAEGMYEGKQIPAVPQWTANAGVEYLPNENWRLRYMAVYTGKRFASSDVANTGKELAGYWLQDASMQYMLPYAIFSFEVLNIFDQRYPLSASYNSRANRISFYPGEGRGYLLTIKINVD